MNGFNTPVFSEPATAANPSQSFLNPTEGLFSANPSQSFLSPMEGLFNTPVFSESATSANPFQSFLSGAQGLFQSFGSPILGTAAIMNAYNNLGGIGTAAQQGAQAIANQQLEQTQFQPFGLTTGTGSSFGYDPQTGNATITISGPEQTAQALGLNRYNELMQMDPEGAGRMVGLGNTLATQGENRLAIDPAGMGDLKTASEAAFGMGEEFRTKAQYEPSDINLMRFKFADQVPGLLSQQPSAAIGQLGQQALGLGASGLATTAPQDVEALRRQYRGLASQSAQDVLTPTGAREQDVYSRIRATQLGEEERQRLQLEERLANQGRLGVRTSMFGGTPEQFAMAKAQEEAQNQASLMAIQQAQSERQQALGTAQTLGGMFGQQAGLSNTLQSAAQQRATQLSQLGLSANQIESQLRSEGLGRASTAAAQSASLAQTSGALQAQKAGLDLQYTGLGANLAQQRQAMDAANQAQALQALQMSQGMYTGAEALRGAQQQRAAAALSSAYVPQAQALHALQATSLFPQLQQRGQLQGAGLYGEAAMGGLEALLASGIGQANMMGQLGTGLLTGSMGGGSGGSGGFSLQDLLDLLGR